jgi:hypothetical protein
MLYEMHQLLSSDWRDCSDELERCGAMSAHSSPIICSVSTYLYSKDLLAYHAESFVFLFLLKT